MQYAWTKVTMCVETFLINTIASFLQALTCYLDTRAENNLAVPILTPLDTNK